MKNAEVMMSVSELVRGHDLFQTLSPQEVERVSRFSAVKPFAKGEVVHHKDRPASHLFVLLDGQVRLHLPVANGELSLVVGRIGKGELFGIAPLLGAERYTTTARCAESCEVLAIEATPFMALLKDNPYASQELVTRVARAYFARYEALLGRFQAVIDQLAG